MNEKVKAQYGKLLNLEYELKQLKLDVDILDNSRYCEVIGKNVQFNKEYYDLKVRILKLRLVTVELFDKGIDEELIGELDKDVKFFKEKLDKALKQWYKWKDEGCPFMFEGGKIDIDLDKEKRMILEKIKEVEILSDEI